MSGDRSELVSSPTVSASRAAAEPFVEPFIWANRRFLNLPDYGLRRAMSRS